MTIITLSIAGAIAAIVAAMIFIPGMSSSVFQGLGKAFFQVLSENRDKRIERRRKNGIFGLRNRRDVDEEVESEDGTSFPAWDSLTEEEQAQVLAADAAIEADADYKPEPSVEDDRPLRGRIRERIKQRRHRREP